MLSHFANHTFVLTFFIIVLVIIVLSSSSLSLLSLLQTFLFQLKTNVIHEWADHTDELITVLSSHQSSNLTKAWYSLLFRLFNKMQYWNHLTKLSLHTMSMSSLMTLLSHKNPSFSCILCRMALRNIKNVCTHMLSWHEVDTHTITTKVTTQYVNYIKHTLFKMSLSSLNHLFINTLLSKQLYFDLTTSWKQFVSTLKASLHLLIKA